MHTQVPKSSHATNEATPQSEIGQRSSGCSPYTNSPLQLQKTFANPSVPLSPSQVAQLQKTIGNRAVTQLLASRLQAAQQVQQLKAENTVEEPSQQQPVQKKENATGMPDQLKSGLEQLSGINLSDMKVHYNSGKPAQLSALAYAQGSNIYVGPGQEKHLPHEGWHVVQQKLGRVKPTMQMKETPVNDDPALENEADVMGAKAFRMPDVTQLQQNEHGNTEQAPFRPAAAQMMGVVQRSAASDADSAAAQDQQVAAGKLRLASERIESARNGGENAMDDSNDMLDEFPVVLGGTVATRRTVPLNVNRGNGIETLRVPVDKVAEAIEHCKQQGWPYEVTNLPKGYAQLKSTETVQRAATAGGFGGGHMNEYAAKGVVAAAPNLANGTITYVGVTGHNTSTGATGADLYRQPLGGGVGATRPNNWTDFIAIIGAINPFKQGHQMSQKLGGDGTHDNLAPFTGSLNALHETRVESHVKNQTDDIGRDEFANYSTTPGYAGNPGIVAWAQLQFAGMTTANQLAAMVTTGILTPVAAAAIPAAAPLPALQLGMANAWIANYVNAAFPTNISCTATFIDDAGGGNYNATAPQTVTITNDF